jgi:hypothetical protein
MERRGGQRRVGHRQIHFSQCALADDVVGERGGKVDSNQRITEKARRMQLGSFGQKALAFLIVYFSCSCSVADSVETSALQHASKCAAP